MRSAAEQLMREMELTDSLIPSKIWLNKHGHGKSMRFHHHFTSAVATVFYVEGSERCGDLVLIDPRGANPYFDSMQGNIDIRIAPVPGKLVAFPGALIHGVDSNPTTVTRTVIAGNWDRKLNEQ